MATSKKNETELTVEERLKTLYELQTIKSEGDRIRSLRGELPGEVKDLEDEIEGLNTRIGKLNEEIQRLEGEINKQHVAIDEAGALIDKYTSQQDNVRNNREYDFLTKEIEYQHLNIELAEKKINDFTRQCENVSGEINRAEDAIEDRRHILAEKKEELEEIVGETKREEERLGEAAKKLEAKIDTRLLTAFKRIRKNARNGLAVVYVQRNACGGCFNRIPAQRQMEIKMRKKVIVCEYCGRILIDPEIAGVSDADAGNK